MRVAEKPASFPERHSVLERSQERVGSFLPKSENSNSLRTSVQPDSIMQLSLPVPAPSSEKMGKN